jgi:hypothetical protein
MWHNLLQKALVVSMSIHVLIRVRVVVVNANFRYIVSVSFIGGGNQKKPEKTSDLPRVTNKLYHIMFIEYTSPWAGFKLYWWEALIVQVVVNPTTTITTVPVLILFTWYCVGVAMGVVSIFASFTIVRDIDFIPSQVTAHSLGLV